MQTLAFYGAALCPREHNLSLFRESLIALAPFDDHDSELGLELLNSRRKRGLGDIANRRGARKMAFLSQRNKVFKFASDHPLYVAVSGPRHSGYNVSLYALNRTERLNDLNFLSGTG